MTETLIHKQNKIICMGKAMCISRVKQTPGNNKYSQFHAKFSRHVPISSESSRIENNLANHRTSQQRDLYFNMHCSYPMLESENERVYVIV